MLKTWFSWPVRAFGEPDFFKILSVVIYSERVSFLSKKLTAWYIEHYRSFKIKWKKSQPDEHDSQSLGSISSLDTVSMDYSGSQANSLSPGYLRRLLQVPIPTLSLDIELKELKLRRDNESYEKTQQGIDVSRDMKIEILDKITQSHDIKAYPDHGESESIASALIQILGKGKGYEGCFF